MTTMFSCVLAILLLPSESQTGNGDRSLPLRTVVEETVDGAEIGRDTDTTAAISGAGEAMRINSIRSDFDREESMAYFEGEVVVNYFPDYRLDCDRLFVFFKDRSFDRLIADGHVAISNDVRYGFCDRATFSRNEGEIEMFGGKSVAKATILETGENLIKGERIKFWINADQVEIEGSDITINKGKDKGGIKNI